MCPYTVYRLLCTYRDIHIEVHMCACTYYIRSLWYTYAGIHVKVCVHICMYIAIVYIHRYG